MERHSSNMNGQQMNLHSEKFDLCRICLMEPESHRDIRFLHIFHHPDLDKQIFELLGVKVDNNDIKPKFICESCHKSMLVFLEMKKKASEAQVVINYIAKKKFGINPPGTNQVTTMGNYPTSSSQSSMHSSQKPMPSTSSAVNSPSTQENVFGNNSGILPFSSYELDKSREPSPHNNDSDSDDTSCKVINIKNEVICISDSEESVQGNVEKSMYCTICKMVKNSNHDCSHHNKEFSTCLVPNCNILSRSIKDITPHYRQHMALPSNALLCKFCYQEVKMFECDANGQHINCVTTNVFKCYTCNIRFSVMAEFANHKLKTHKCQLINHTGNYLCLHCEYSSSDLMIINEHMKECRGNVIVKTDMKEIKRPIINKPKLFTKVIINDDVNVPNGVSEHKKQKEKKTPRSSQFLLFTCLKPSCNLIFYNFSVFKYHHREHFGINTSKLICWQCCTPFPNLNGLRMHQVKGHCIIPGMFKCYQCNEGFNDIQSLSIHKYTVHDGNLIVSKKGKKCMICAYCKFEIDINIFKNHLIHCAVTNGMKKTNLLKKGEKWHKCSICGKMCLTAAALSSHKKIHDSASSKRIVKKRMSNMSNSLTKPEHQLPANTSHGTEINEVLDQTSSTSQGNDINASIGHNTDNSINNKNVEEEMNQSISSQFQSSKINYDIFPFEDGFYSCIKCSKKFGGKMGLSKHWPFCSKMRKSNYELPPIYYCTKCNEHYNRITFGHHWKLNHGKRLPSQKNKRFTCNKCSIKFLYKIALSMHNEYVHGYQGNSHMDNHTAVNDEVLLNVSDPVNLSRNIVEESEENIKMEHEPNTSISKNEQKENTTNEQKENNTKQGENENVSIKIEFNSKEQENDDNAHSDQTVGGLDNGENTVEQISDKNAMVVEEIAVAGYEKNGWVIDNANKKSSEHQNNSCDSVVINDA